VELKTLPARPLPDEYFSVARTPPKKVEKSSAGQYCKKSIFYEKFFCRLSIQLPFVKERNHHLAAP